MIVRQHAQDIMKHLRDTHLPFFLETERFVVEITRSFKPSYEQQLQHIIGFLMDSLTREDLAKPVSADVAKKMEEIPGAQFTCFTGTKVQILTPLARVSTASHSLAA